MVLNRRRGYDIIKNREATISPIDYMQYEVYYIMIRKIVHEVDFCVVGGGMAGLCAAIAAARMGAKTVLMQERPVLGGNASSEIRMWISGSAGKPGCRETGILEDIQLENLYYNPDKLWPVWDGVLWNAANREKNLELLLNCSCCDAEMDGSRIVSVTGWQMTSQQWHTVKAKLFADCSGDSVLAPLTGAAYRVGRESKYEFDENISEETADLKTMGNSCLIQARKLDHPVKFVSPPWALKLTAADLQNRRPNLQSSGENFWYLELGGNRDTIGDAEAIRDDLLALAYGMWDYIKNSGEFDADCWQLDFLGFLPGKRESRRMVGDLLMNQNHITSGGRFEDTIAFGGWPLDDHDPDGFWHIGRPCVQVATPAPYGIPYRTLYSKNIDNLFFAGRNISMTHAAMSSTRVMATCAVIGQAAGTAAAIAVKYGLSPRGVYLERLNELQQTLLKDDCFLPFVDREISPLTASAALTASSHTGDLELLRNGIDRVNHIYGGTEQSASIPVGGYVQYAFDKPEELSELRMVFDSDLDRRTLPGDGVERSHSMRANTKPDSPTMIMPKTLVKSFRVDISTDGENFEPFFTEELNLCRLVRLPLGVKAKAVRLIPLAMWSDYDSAALFALDVY